MLCGKVAAGLRRLADLGDATHVQELAADSLCEFDGELRGQIAVELGGDYVTVASVNHQPAPTAESGGADGVASWGPAAGPRNRGQHGFARQ